jgi:hypothetical protein
VISWIGSTFESSAMVRSRLLDPCRRLLVCGGAQQATDLSARHAPTKPVGAIY